ncbi:MAG: hypothetical protein HYV28_11400 [Ignavibacteriales bacterium]|nr:hypothetical protein [Ignavibacteriales bacterium]
MITILDIDRNSSAQAGEFLTSMEIPCKISKQEFDLCKSTHVIIPPTQDINTLMRKMHMYNLHSMLRMIKKPLLVIGSSLPVMFDSAPGCNESMLGYFRDTYCSLQEGCITKGEVPVKVISGSSMLLAGLGENFTVTMDFFCPIDAANNNITAVLQNAPQYAVAFEKAPFYGLLFNPFTHLSLGKQIIKNFAATALVPNL